MRKKLEALLQSGRAAGHAEFDALYRDYQAAGDALTKARAERKASKKAYHAALDERRADSEHLFEVLIHLRKAKYLRQYQRAIFQLAKHRLRHWLEEYLHQMEAKPASAKSKKVKKAAKGSMAKAPITTDKKTPKSLKSAPKAAAVKSASKPSKKTPKPATGKSTSKTKANLASKRKA